MRLFWKVLLVLLVTMPMGAYVAGTLVASQADVPVQRNPIVVREDPLPPTPTISSSPSADPTRHGGDDRDDDHGNRGRGSDDDHAEDSEGPDDVDTINPSPDDVDHENGDNSGPGGGGDDGGGGGDNSGSGSGGDGH